MERCWFNMGFCWLIPWFTWNITWYQDGIGSALVYRLWCNTNTPLLNPDFQIKLLDKMSLLDSDLILEGCFQLVLVRGIKDRKSNFSFPFRTTHMSYCKAFNSVLQTPLANGVWSVVMEMAQLSSRDKWWHICHFIRPLMILTKVKERLQFGWK